MWFEPVFGAILFGVITVLVGYVSGFVVSKMNNSEVPEECKNWNKNYVMEKSLFITGALTWLISFAYMKYVLS
jgi:hypothetical protein